MQIGAGLEPNSNAQRLPRWHTYCAQIGTSWDADVGAYHAFSVSESRYGTARVQGLPIETAQEVVPIVANRGQ